MKIVHQLSIAFLLTASVAMAQGTRGEAKVVVAGKSVAVEYGRPILAGRDMLGQAKAGTPWRMGSGSPTSLKTDADLMFGSVAVPKGAYILTAVKDDKGGWSMIASKAEGGAKVAEIPLKSEMVKEPVDTFTIGLTGKGDAGDFSMSWGTAKMSASFTGK
ncbi:MAG: DUF2911 domain-containing protein [Vicinamibacteria bacterium]